MAKKKTEERPTFKVEPANEKPQVVTEQKTNWTWIIIGLLVGLIILGIALWQGTPRAGATEVCPDGGAWQKDDTAYNGFDETCYGGKKVTEVCIKGGTNIAYYTTNGNDGCWARSGIGTNEGDAWKIGSGPSCKDISHASFKCEYVSPTPTPTKTPTPTPTPTTEPTPPPEVCEQESWTCSECQELNDNICWDDQQKYCGEEYGCGWQEVCPTNGEVKLLQECYKEWICEDVCEEPTPTPTQPPTVTTQSTPSGCTQNCGAPACTDTTPEGAVNPHVYRQGDCAIVKYYPKSGDKVNLYWKENSSADWQHALANQPATGSHEICGLISNGDYTFAVQTVNGCAADGIVNASNLSVIVDGATNGWVLFR